MVDIPTERTTAATDLLLAIIALGCLVAIARYRSYHPWKVGLWISIFAMLVVASGLGSVAHGLTMSAETNRMLWHPLNLALGVMVALIVVAAILDKWGERSNGLCRLGNPGQGNLDEAGDCPRNSIQHCRMPADALNCGGMCQS